MNSSGSSARHRAPGSIEPIDSCTSISTQKIMTSKKVVSLAVGSAFVATALTPLAHAVGDNPFAATKLQAG
ncbi:MAG: hypothetical protein H6R19_3704 [Proteobacteria bacterium]|jgi:hypothetical protein|nr:hypothetical protein [Pseudomonadota bacterium]